MPDGFIDPIGSGPTIEGGSVVDVNDGQISAPATALSSAPWMSVSLNVASIRGGGK